MGSWNVSTCVGLGIFLTLAGLSSGNFPVLDVDTNMRIVLIPHDTKVGTIVYRLRATDSDNNFPLAFEVLGSLGKSLLSLKFLGCSEAESLCQADVMLNKHLDLGRTYEFQIQVKDTTGDYTKVQAVITATPGHSDTASSFFGPSVLHVPENAAEGSLLEKFVVVKNELNSRTVLLELRDPDERVELRQRLLSNNKTEGSLLLTKKLDFETEPWFTFQLLAMNAQTNISVDTRNILMTDVLVAVHDIQDSPPTFTLLPSSVEIPSHVRPGDLLTTVKAQDGDKQNKRLIRYGFLTDANPFVVFFDLDPMSGEIRLKRNLTELLTMAKPSEPITMTVIAEEILTESTRMGRSTQSTKDRSMANITFWLDRSSSYGPPKFSSERYVGEVKENSVLGTIVKFGIEPRVWHLNEDEIIALSFRSTGNTQSESAFEILPSHGTGNFSFEVRVMDSKILDYETIQTMKLTVVGETTSGSAEAEVTILIRDVNDESPVFTQEEYVVLLTEHPPKGLKVVTVKAVDKDTAGNYGQVIYSNLLGSDAFHLNSLTGEITVDKPELIDREIESEIRLYVEAKDGGYTEFSSDSERNIATATVVIKLTDKNDQMPIFYQKYYQAVLTTDLTSFKNPVFVKAFDRDEGANSQVRYQVQDTRFFVDPNTGELRLRGAFPRTPTDGGGPYLGFVKVKAYDLGTPQQSSETIVQLFSEEMVSREIQFVFPQATDRIKKNQTNIEKMLSSLTGGIVAIQKVTPLPAYGRTGVSPSKVSPQQDLSKSGLSTETSTELSSSALARINELPQQRHPVGLSSASDKSLVTATVQYPVSDTPTRVDLAAWQKAYMTAQEPPERNSSKDDSSTKAVIEVYKAENRILFWILILFLLLLLILFTVFLCCIYCPCCWLYGYCYRRSAKAREYSGDEKRMRHSRKTYPLEDDMEYESHYRKEAWSGGDDRKVWRVGNAPVSSRNYPITPRHRPGPIVRKIPREIHQPPIPIHARNVEGDVALEDWEFEPQMQRHNNDRAEEIAPRWIQQQHPNNQPQQQQSLPQQQQQQQQPVQGAPIMRRVAYVGNPHPGDETFVRNVRGVDGGADGGEPASIPANFVYTTAGDHPLPRNYPQMQRSETHSLPPQDSRAQSHFRPRQTRFFRTETGEVLQFGDFEGDEGKELLMKRFMEDASGRGSEENENNFESSGRMRGETETPAPLSANVPPQRRGGHQGRERERERVHHEHGHIGRRHGQGHRTTDHHDQVANVNKGHSQGQGFIADSGKYLGEDENDEEEDMGGGGGGTSERPKAAVVSRRPQRVSVAALTKEVAVDEGEDDEVERESEEKEYAKKNRGVAVVTNAPVDHRRRHFQSQNEQRERERERDAIAKQRERDRSRKRQSRSVSRSRSGSEDSLPLPVKRKGKSRSESRSQSHGRSHSKSKSKSQSVSQSVSQSQSQSKSRSQSLSRSKSKSPVMSKSKSKSKSKSVSRSKSKSLTRARNAERSRSRSRSRSEDVLDFDYSKVSSSHELSHEKEKEREHRKKSKTKEEQLRSSHPHRYVKQHSKDAETQHSHHNVHKATATAARVAADKDARKSRRSKEKELQRNNNATRVPVPVESVEVDDPDHDPYNESPIDTPPAPAVVHLLTQTQGQTTIESEDTEQLPSQVAINIICPSSARTDSSQNHDNDSNSNTPPETATVIMATSSSSRFDHEDHENELHQEPHEEDEDDSGIGIVGVQTKRNKMLERKSVFTIAYDEMAQKVLRPDTANNDGDSEIRS